MTASDDTHLLVASMPFAVSLGVQLDTAEAEEVRGHLDWAAALCTLGGALHGAAIMALADSIGAICAYLNLPDGASTATLNSTSNFFRGVREGTLHARAHPLHVGRTTITVHTDLHDQQNRRVAQTTQTQAVLSEES